jgi:hypothetical protein
MMVPTWQMFRLRKPGVLELGCGRAKDTQIAPSLASIATTVTDRRVWPELSDSASVLDAAWLFKGVCVMKQLVSTLMVVAGLFAFTATATSAAVVCNEDGDCWRTKEKYTYPPKAGVRIYADDWTWGPKDKYRWREARPGPGYWSKGVWIEF